MGIMNGHDRIRTTSALYCIYANRGFDAGGLPINGQSTVTLSTVCAPLYFACALISFVVRYVRVLTNDDGFTVSQFPSSSSCS
jgi:hypothetical protein